MGLPDRTKFPAFPYQPYQIQQDFMEELYKTLEMGCIGLFESPTGHEAPYLAAAGWTSCQGLIGKRGQERERH